MVNLSVVDDSSSFIARTMRLVNDSDLTASFGLNLASDKERVVKSVAGRRHLALSLELAPEEAAARLARFVRGLGVKALTISGNGIYTLDRQGWNQTRVDDWMFQMLQALQAQAPVNKVLCSGQEGVELAAASAAIALDVPVEAVYPKGYVTRDVDGVEQSHSEAAILRLVMSGAARYRPELAELVEAEPPAAASQSFDLSAVGVYLGEYQDGQKTHGLSVVDMSGAHHEAIMDLGFSEAPGEFGRGVYVRASTDLTLEQLQEAFGRENVKLVDAGRAETQAMFSNKVREKTNMNTRAFFAQEKALGLNHLAEEVYEGVSGRFVLRRDEQGKATVVRDGADVVDPAVFLHAPDREALGKVAYGFVSRIVKRGEYLRKADVKALIDLSNAGEFSERDYQEHIEAAALTLFSHEIARVGRSGMGAFPVAHRIFSALPDLTVRTSNSVANMQYSTPLPMSVLTQVLLTGGQDRPGASYLDPTIGNGSLVSMIKGGEIFGVEIDDDRIGRLPGHVTQCVHGDATEVNFRGVFGKPEGFDFVIANPPFGGLEEVVTVSLPEGSAIDEMVTKRLDHLILLQALHARKPDGRAVFITGSDGSFKVGEIQGRSKALLQYLHSHYEVEGVADVAGDLYRKQGASYPLRLYVIGNRRPEPVEVEELTGLPVIRTYEALKEWAVRVLANEPLAQVEGLEMPKPKVVVKREVRPEVGSVLELLQEGPQPQSAPPGEPEAEVTPPSAPVPPGGADDRENNEFQHRYAAFSRVAEPTTMIPANLSGPIYEALGRIQEKHGDIDTYVGKALKFSFEELQRYFSPEQVDALAMVFDAHDRGLGFLLADKMGVGKGRVLAAVARRERLEGRIPTFVTVGSNLFTDFLERDLADIGSRGLFKKPLLINDGSATLDAQGEVAVKALKRDEYRGYAESGTLPEETDLILLTYSQLSRRAETHLTSRYLGTLAEKYPLSLLLDESHNGAGASNTSQNLEYMVDCLRERGNVIYSSGTPIKGAKNLRLYKRILPEGINHDELLAAVEADPLSLQEALNYEIAAQGCLICRELDDVGINREFVLSENVERNRQVADQMAEILSAMSFLSGDVKKMVLRLNKDFEKELEKVPEEERAGARMGASSMNFGSRLHQINRQFLLALKAKDVVGLALKALEGNRKPIIALQHTGESLLTDFVTRASEQYLEDPKRAKKSIGAVTLEQPVTFRDLMHKYLERIMNIKIMSGYGQVTTKRPSSEEMEDAVERLKGMIDALPGDLPLTPIDYVRDELAKHGYTVGEVSGRGLQAISLGDKGVSIEPVAGRGDKTRIVKTARAFCNGDVDALMVTEAGSTGMSVHASPAVGRDLRQRVMIKWEMQPDIAKERQMDGRPDRTGQVCKPEYQIPMTGLPADDRQAMMFNNKNRNLTASTVANRDSKQIIREVPDLLNVVGDKVAEELLYARPELARHLDIDLPEDLEDAWRKPPLYWINKLTGRISLLRVVEQEALYGDLQSRFEEALDRLKAEGRNPLEVSCHDWKARLVSRSRYMGEVDESRSVSTFNDAIYVSVVEYEQEMRAVRADEIDRKIQFKVEALSSLGVKSAEDVHYRHVAAYLREQRGAILQRHLGKRHTSLVAALEDKNPNEVKNVDEKIQWLLKNIGNLGYGTVYHDHELDGSMSPRVVIGVVSPAAKEDCIRLSDWRIEVMRPGSDQVQHVTLSSLFSKDVELQRWRFKDNPPARSLFDKAENGIVTKQARLLDGNLFEAVAMNLRSRIGTKVVYTNASGDRQHGILVHSNITNAKLWSIPERVRDPNVLCKVLALNAPITTNADGESFGPPAKHATVVMRNQRGEFELRSSKTKLHGGDVFTDPVLTRIKGHEGKCVFNLNFAEYNGKMCATVPESQLSRVIAYLVQKKNIDFYVKDRQTLEKVRGADCARGNEREERAASPACG